MFGAIILIIIGLSLIFGGAKFFWASLFIGLGIYIIYSYYEISKRKKENKKILTRNIEKIIETHTPQEAAKIISEKVKDPVGSKFVILVDTEDAKVRLFFPFGILMSFKPLLIFTKKIIKKKIEEEFSKKDKKIPIDVDEIVDLIMESMDLLYQYYGDFIDVEADNGKTKVKIFIA
ncbi:hypothetical protein XO10_10090 [Marinitoga sp. 1135]|uniref:Uncharacterized protein n=1 Tax=Marinitoga piezophila (strain DSM 14283 / JCM 11233 / KA3) TaxID=443254 RepID=H2J752_MARPK|nr:MULTISPECIES: hypothetical protein [Marinitoga]AEX86422.1 hypothetical protein Marpi_2047 [Marinitoga piezophila KA3]APT76811.1 hypothetical protein LN42_10815 [Marinitoga sp. 1137]NUU96579.1 hypothetical protein [Marinitoga sp. 1135]NUU98510.1 hypothetical protein [Marinitoga sp. 1138]